MSSRWAHLYEGGSGEGGGLWHYHLAFGAVVLGGVRERLPVVPCRHGDKMASLWPPGKLIGYSSDLKGAWVERYRNIIYGLLHQKWFISYSPMHFDIRAEGSTASAWWPGSPQPEKTTFPPLGKTHWGRVRCHMGGSEGQGSQRPDPGGRSWLWGRGTSTRCGERNRSL